MSFTALQNSPLLQSLGWAIANSLWQAAALWIAYHIVNGIYQGASAKFKNTVSTILLSSVFVWFCITLFSKYFAIQTIADSYAQAQPNGITATNNLNWNDLIKNITTVLPYLSIAYLFLLIFLLIRLINTYRFTNFIKANGLQKPGVEWKLFAEKVSRHMGITKKIRLWVSHHIDVPATIGFIKPVILIPLASINQLSTQQMEAIILHELSHIKRNDYLINLFISIIETLLFFNPFVVLLAAIIKKERENCCDDLVIQYQYDRYSYATALLSLEQFRNINFRLAISATSGKKQLLHRVKRIMEINSNTNFNYGQKLAALFLITGLICSIAWLSPQNKNDNVQKANKTQQKNYYTKINKDEKLETLTVKQTGNKVKNTLIKQPAKISLSEIDQSKQPIKDLTVKVMPITEIKHADMMIKQSKKEIAGNKIKVTSKPSAFLFNNAPDNLFSEELKNARDDTHFYFSFDVINMQREILHAFDSKEIKSLQQLYQNQKEEKLIRSKIKNSIEKVKRPKGFKNINIEFTNSKNSFSYFAAPKKSLEATGATGVPQIPAKVFTRSIRFNGKQIPFTPQASGFGYRFNHSNQDKSPSDKSNKVKPRTPRKDDLRIEYKNGIIVINGERIILPDTKKMLAQLKAKNLIPSEEFLLQLHPDD